MDTAKIFFPGGPILVTGWCWWTKTGWFYIIFWLRAATVANLITTPESEAAALRQAAMKPEESTGLATLSREATGYSRKIEVKTVQRGMMPRARARKYLIIECQQTVMADTHQAPSPIRAPASHCAQRSATSPSRPETITSGDRSNAE